MKRGSRVSVFHYRARVKRDEVQSLTPSDRRSLLIFFSSVLFPSRRTFLTMSLFALTKTSAGAAVAACRTALFPATTSILTLSPGCKPSSSRTFFGITILFFEESRAPSKRTTRPVKYVFYLGFTWPNALLKNFLLHLKAHRLAGSKIPFFKIHTGQVRA